MNKQLCELCGKEFTSERGREYCSENCRKKAWRQKNREKDLAQRRAYNKRHWQTIKPDIKDKKCETCSKVFTPSKFTPKQPYCSRLCRDAAWRNNNRTKYTLQRQEERKRLAGYYSKYNKNYKNDTRYGGHKYEVLERDNYMCVDCGKDSPKSLVIHHIDFSGQTDHPNNEMSNLETLCRACHIRKHTHVLNRGVFGSKGDNS